MKTNSTRKELVVYIQDDLNDDLKAKEVVTDSICDVTSILNNHQHASKILLVNARTRFCMEVANGEVLNYYAS
ncbi:hypothetical protein [Cytobacillus sp. IB215665]|uniref:hypothetical protein n=1 Tax=Cytobacillus sp. IB215665 TaxID=3097357 RepID=UPI002A0F6BB5|nr:hypothetical protein [Cytobacillus sp. IB215665]MDX8367694.1 hypothetical protein [Cytobacillus sp. IB215665]